MDGITVAMHFFLKSLFTHMIHIHDHVYSLKCSFWRIMRYNPFKMDSRGGKYLGLLYELRPVPKSFSA